MVPCLVARHRHNIVNLAITLPTKQSIVNGLFGVLVASPPDVEIYDWECFSKNSNTSVESTPGNTPGGTAASKEECVRADGHDA